MDTKTSTARPVRRSRTGRDDRREIPVNRNLSIELTVDEILSDLLYPAGRLADPR
jgi:hypothetical protein